MCMYMYVSHKQKQSQITYLSCKSSFSCSEVDNGDGGDCIVGEGGGGVSSRQEETKLFVVVHHFVSQLDHVPRTYST